MSYLNYRMTDLAASIGNSQIDRFENTLNDRISKAKYYRQNLKNVEYPEELANTKNCFFFFLILANNRDKLNNYLNKNGIDTRITYPLPLNEQSIFRKYSKEVFEVAKKISKKVISLPIHYNLSIDEQDYIIKKINDFGV